MEVSAFTRTSGEVKGFVSFNRQSVRVCVGLWKISGWVAVGGGSG